MFAVVAAVCIAVVLSGAVGVSGAVNGHSGSVQGKVRPAGAISTCPTGAAFSSAVAAGGVFTFAISCSILINATIYLVGVTTVLNVSSGAYHETLIGNYTQIFEVLGGSLTIANFSLVDGAVVGYSGATGA
ncbi:MAG: hypothetical protein ACHQ2Y_08640, partial [Candidatus Lutacidiplasmatales archaeon]